MGGKKTKSATSADECQGQLRIGQDTVFGYGNISEPVILSRVDTTLRQHYLNNVFASHFLHQVLSFLHDHAFHACLPEAKSLQMPQSEATHFLPVGAISEYQAYNRNCELVLIDDKHHSFTLTIMGSKIFTTSN